VVQVATKTVINGLQLTYDSLAVHCTLLAAHECSFRDWLNLQFAAQCEDLVAYLDGLNVKRALKAWSDSEPWHAIAAPSADEVTLRLFASDFRKLLELLQRCCSDHLEPSRGDVCHSRYSGTLRGDRPR
jgi:hypothetical protein